MEKWTEEKRKARMLEYKKEQDEKRKQESRPYQKPKTKPTPPLVELHLSELNIIRCLYFYEF